MQFPDELVLEVVVVQKHVDPQEEEVGEQLLLQVAVGEVL